ncbi:MAG: response regulator [Candidatus Parabeggiatoa sp.]|nr:response regulator [Candidatus Parabeggiatoa sp.]
MTSKASILVVDDTLANLRLLIRMLSQQGYQVRPASSGHQALLAAREEPPDLILLDIMMSNMDGYTVCEHLKKDERTRDIPVIFISALSEVLDKVKAFSVGGVDYISKPFQLEEVLARLKTHIALQNLQKQVKAREAALRESQQKYKSLVHSIEGVVWEAEPKTFQFTFISKQAERFFGYPYQNWLNDPHFWTDHIHPDDRNRVLAYCAERVVAEKEHHFEYRMITENNRTIWIKMLITVVLDNHQAVKLCGVMFDITEQKQMEIALQSAHDDLEMKVETRTTALKTANAQLQEEVIERKRAEIELKEYQDQLEDLVEKRTLELKQANQQLQEEIAERKLTEKALRENQKTLAKAQKIAHLGNWHFDLATNQITWSDEIYHIFDLNPQTFQPTLETIFEHFHPDDVFFAKEKLAEIVQGTRLMPIEHRIIRPNGEIRFVEWQNEVEYAIDNKPIRFVGTLQDITERKRAENSLKRFRAALDNAADAIFIIDRDKMKFVDMNQMACDSLGYSRDELLSLGPHDIKPSLTQAQLAAQFDEVIQSRRQGKIETIHQRKTGSEFPVEILLQSRQFDDGYLLVASIRDVTERKKFENSLKQAKEAAESANRAKSEFLANMSHEIRTPMNAVIGFSELLSSLVTDKKQKNYLKAIQMAGKALLTLINDILDLSKIEAGRLEIEYEAINPYTIFNELKQIFAVKITEKPLVFLLELDQALPPALILDETRLRQVLLNLIGNAIKFTDKGYIKLQAQKIYTQENRSKLDLIIAVEDTGIGIPDEQQAMIFESFRQQDGQSVRQYGGTGLGLAISKRLVEMMNGQICVKSTVGLGSVFEITLRDVEVSSTVLTESEGEGFNYEDIVFEKALVLVVDDIEANRNLIQEWLSQVNLDVIEAENGIEALLFAEEYQPNLILMDIRMPVLDGYEASQKLKENQNTQNIPVIALTASVTLEEKTKVEALGFDGFLSKPINISELFNELSHHLKYTAENTPDAPKIKPSVLHTTMINPKEIAHLAELKSKLKKEVMPLWEDINAMMETDVVAEFAEKLIQLGDEYNLSLFIDYGEQLLEYTQDFDIPYIQKAIDEFPEMLKPLSVNNEPLSVNHG